MLLFFELCKCGSVYMRDKICKYTVVQKRFFIHPPLRPLLEHESSGLEPRPGVQTARSRLFSGVCASDLGVAAVLKQCVSECVEACLCRL